MKKEFFDIKGMTCSACANRITKTITNLKGVHEVNVNLLRNNMVVSFNEHILSASEIIATVLNTGYEASLQATNASLKNKVAVQKDDPTAIEYNEMKYRLIISLIFTIPLFYIAMGHMLGLPMPGFFIGSANGVTFAFTQFLLTIPVVFVNFKFFRVGFKTLFSGSPNMDTLIALGSGAAVLFGIYAIYKMIVALAQNNMAIVEHFAMSLYFESAAIILTLITLGKFLEAKAKGKTSDAIAKLIDLAPKTAMVLRNGGEQIIPLEDVVVGDILVVKAGEKVPVDGIIIDGNGCLNEAAITGESLPLEKNKGDSVTGATINTSGYFTMRVTRIGDNTTLAQIIKLVDEASSSKAPIAKLADKISGIFVPVVIAIAILATTVWLLLGYDLEFALAIGISVLVISCPCALGLATPTAIMVGTGRGANNGILFKSAETIEIAQSINTVVLDKTGTITKGKPVVTEIITTNGIYEQEILNIVASLENLSEHPLGQAIIDEAKKRNLEFFKVSDFKQTVGQGISGTIEGIHYLIGNIKMLKAHNIDATYLKSKGEALADEGKTALYFANKDNLLGIIAIADEIKPTSRQAVAELINMGIDVIMLTGDNTKTAANIQRQVGIPHVLAEIRPQDKEREISTLQKQGKVVAMIGDGVNDAPALARADVGIAIGAGTEIAIESANIVLMKSDLLDSVTAIQLSKAVMRTIRQNLFWAFFYNTLGIPFAAGVFFLSWGLTLNPMIAAATMSLSSVSVVTNALRLRFFSPKFLTQKTPNFIKKDNAMKKIIQIEGMTCGHCSNRVEKILETIDGVTDVTIDLKNKTARVKVDLKVTDSELKNAITGAGYEVIDINIVI